MIIELCDKIMVLVFIVHLMTVTVTHTHTHTCTHTYPYTHANNFVEQLFAIEVILLIFTEFDYAIRDQNCKK